ncbi:zinc finger, CCHC-type containing protein [Tanacetum coccineum]
MARPLWTNYKRSLRQVEVRIVLSIEDKLNYLEQPFPPAPVAPESQQVAPEIIAAHNAWIKDSKEIARHMLMTMEPEIQRNLENLHAKGVKNSEEGQYVSSYVLKMKSYVDNLERLRHPVTFGKEFDGFVHNYNMHNLGKTVNELHAMLKLHEQTLPKNNAPGLHVIRAGKGKNKLAYAPKPKIPPPPKREYPAKDSICHECGETGHWKRNCPQYLAELLKKKNNTASGAGGSGIFTIELYTFLNRSWIYDNVCGTHICNPTQGLRASRKLKPGALSLYVGNGQREAVEAIGVFLFMSPEWIGDCFEQFVIPKDGIFEIGLSNSYANKSSIYTVSNKRDKLDLDSALLWHCRLGHISKKCIEKLQHDGLLNSTDLKIIAHRTPPYTPQHNGVSERRNRTLLDMVRSMMSQTTLPKSFWDYALETAARILNMVPTKKVEKTPYEVWHGQAPKLSYFKVAQNDKTGLGMEKTVKDKPNQSRKVNQVCKKQAAKSLVKKSKSTQVLPRAEGHKK